jgi:hypothetical protein
MPTPWKTAALWSLLFFSVTAASTSAQQFASHAVLADQICGPDRISGQYECVTSVPLSEHEVHVNLAYLAALESLAVRRALIEEQPLPSVIAARQQAALD